MKKNKYNFKPLVCECCGQAKTYLLPLDWGTKVIVQAVARKIRLKKINTVHPTKEMEVPATEWTYERALKEGVLTSKQIGNLTRARVHGLLAKNKKEAGNWILTTKGAKFLKGEMVPKLAEILKTQTVNGKRSHKMRYFEPEKHTTTIQEIEKTGEKQIAWEAIDFEIVEGRVILDEPKKGDSTHIGKDLFGGIV